jgi:hypothetical protein
MSEIADKVYDILIDMFPTRLVPRVRKEVYVNYKAQRLFFDFYVKELDIYVEVQGQQHEKFIKHFHVDKETFDKQKRNDNLKIQYVQEKNKCLIRFNYNEKITRSLIRKKINKAMTSESGFWE